MAVAAASCATVVRVCSEVPGPGSDKASRFSVGRPNCSSASKQTKSAKVESSPPEVPSTSRSTPAPRMRRLRPAL